jgi:hypothetical protein
MKKTIIISERQFKEILEGDFNFLNKGEVHNGTTEISLSNKIDSENGMEESEPITGDEFASNRVTMNFWNGLGKGHGHIVNCSKKKEVSILETNDSLKYRTWVIPNSIKKIMVQNLRQFNGDKNAAGYDRLRNLINMQNISYYELKRLKNFYDNMTDDNQNEFELYGGNKMKQWVYNTLLSSRNMIEIDKESKVKMNKPNAYRVSPTNKNVTIYN